MTQNIMTLRAEAIVRGMNDKTTATENQRKRFHATDEQSRANQDESPRQPREVILGSCHCVIAKASRLTKIILSQLRE